MAPSNIKPFVYKRADIIIANFGCHSNKVQKKITDSLASEKSRKKNKTWSKKKTWQLTWLKKNRVEIEVIINFWNFKIVHNNTEHKNKSVYNKRY